MKEFRVYKSGLAFFALIDGLYNILYKVSSLINCLELFFPLFESFAPSSTGLF